MALLLHIDTATPYAGICLSNNETVLAIEENHDARNHASFLQPAIQKIMHQTGHALQELDAVAVTGGPGSYTGIRVAMASAKGICYALQKPLIVLNTLQVIAQAALDQLAAENLLSEKEWLLYPMIDARRMEVFSAAYTHSLMEKEAAAAILLNEQFFDTLPKNVSILFCGDGAAKIPGAFLKSNMQISSVQHNVNHMIRLANTAYARRHFANLAYAEPLYAKGFYNTQKQ
ncbi:MAG TPA: tRNA (adenosine(37)-N6)-threonylcarbamoyltransferase complex dimerization subunit type 1 TsaB [Sediminibacterium sp.]|nr:tRNA (adenosine(37)-N6)-threonylcarbamoyltransferase complex dimerization subunit type 1 TsaB [Sediminibacterium sp.]